jgi:hypothetical protein
MHLPNQARQLLGQSGMKHYQLRTGYLNVSDLVDRITDTVKVMVPEVPSLEVRHVARVILGSRAFGTASCGHTEACERLGPRVFRLGGEGPAPSGRACGLRDIDARDLPQCFATTVSDRHHPPAPERVLLERRLSDAFEQAIAPYLFVCDACGNDPTCGGRPVDPM